MCPKNVFLHFTNPLAEIAPFQFVRLWELAVSFCPKSILPPSLNFTISLSSLSLNLILPLSETSIFTSFVLSADLNLNSFLLTLKLSLITKLSSSILIEAETALPADF